MDMLTVVGLLTFIAVVALLVKGPFTPIVVFTVVPVIGGFVAGYSPREIGEFVKAGFTTIQGPVIETTFAIFYFSIMSDVGMFEVITRPIIGKVGKSKSPVTAIMIAAAAVACIGHLDGAGTTTIMITLPLMMPLFDKMKIDRRALGLCMGISVGAMNLVPWTGPTRYTAIVLNMDTVGFWRYILPAQIIMILLGFVVAFLLSRRELGRGAINSVDEIVINQEDSDSPCVRNKKIFIFNVSLTVILLTVLVAGFLHSGLTFMICGGVALLVNYHGKKLQEKKIKVFSKNILNMTLNVMSVGVLIGVMRGGGFIDALAEAITQVMPETVGQYTYLIIAALAAPLLMMLGTSPFYQGLLPVIVGVCAKYGADPILAASVILVPASVAVSLSPLVPANLIACGMLNYEMGDAIRYSWKWVIAVSLIAIPITYFTVKLFM
jgi:CitMHS family citrate-Mg2+:H+ or citrate-Ca2+:H+ symporter